MASNVASFAVGWGRRLTAFVLPRARSMTAGSELAVGIPLKRVERLHASEWTKEPSGQ